MYIGMQHLKVGNYTLSKEYLFLAQDMCKQDPLLLQELGILYYNLEEYVEFSEYLDMTMLSQNIRKLLRLFHRVLNRY